MMGQPVKLNMIIAMVAMALLFCRDRKVVYIYHPRPYPHNTSTTLKAVLSAWVIQKM